MCRASKQAELFAISTILRQVFNWTYVSAFIRILFFRISTEFGVSHLDLASHHHPAEITNSRVSQPNFASNVVIPRHPQHIAVHVGCANASVQKYNLVGGWTTHLKKKHGSNWIILTGRGENKKCLKTPPRKLLNEEKKNPITPLTSVNMFAKKTRNLWFYSKHFLHSTWKMDTWKRLFFTLNMLSNSNLSINKGPWKWQRKGINVIHGSDWEKLPKASLPIDEKYDLGKQRIYWW